MQYTVPSQLLLPRNALKKKKWLLLSLRRQELYLINGQTSEAVVCTVNRIKYHSFTVGQRKITTDGMMFFLRLKVYSFISEKQQFVTVFRYGKN